MSDDQAEFQIRDRLTFIRFLGLGPGDAVPDAKTIWLFRVHTHSSLRASTRCVLIYASGHIRVKRDLRGVQKYVYDDESDNGALSRA
jgi:Tfp pilus assembly protein FimT